MRSRAWEATTGWAAVAVVFALLALGAEAALGKLHLLDGGSRVAVSIMIALAIIVFESHLRSRV